MDGRRPCSICTAAPCSNGCWMACKARPVWARWWWWGWMTRPIGMLYGRKDPFTTCPTSAVWWAMCKLACNGCARTCPRRKWLYFARPIFPISNRLWWMNWWPSAPHSISCFITPLPSGKSSRRSTQIQGARLQSCAMRSLRGEICLWCN